MRNWLLRWLAPEEVYVTWYPSAPGVGFVHTTFQGAAESLLTSDGKVETAQLVID